MRLSHAAPVDGIAAGLFKGEKSGPKACTDPQNALRESLEWACRGIEDVNNLVHLDNELRVAVLRLICDLQSNEFRFDPGRSAIISAFQGWLAEREPFLNDSGRWVLRN